MGVCVNAFPFLLGEFMKAFISSSSAAKKEVSPPGIGIHNLLVWCGVLVC